MTDESDTRMRPREAAEYLRLSESTLAKMRMRGGGPLYVKAGPRLVLYRQSSLDGWLVRNRRRSTSEEAAAV
jgi:predicted DNA-binding transcriptional regulator AlpA